MYGDPTLLWLGHETRAATFENPTAARGAGGLAADGRKGSPMRLLAPGETVTLADLSGPGRVTHVWLTLGHPLYPGSYADPRLLRSQVIEVFYGSLAEPSVSAPVGDLFGSVHGVVHGDASALTAVNEARGFTSRVPMPFRDAIRITYANRADHPVLLYYQVDLLLGPQPDDTGVLHASFRRENPTTIRRDFTVVEEIEGPGRFLGWTGGVRVADQDHWWGEGEMKFFLDGEPHPTICGTGTEDYLGSAWGLGTFSAPESGAAVWSASGATDDNRHALVSFYRWHLSDPVVFARSLRATIQQIGYVAIPEGEASAFTTFDASHEMAGGGWLRGIPGFEAIGIFERSDDWCGTAFVYATEPQPVPRYDVAAGAADLVPTGGLHLVERPAVG